MKQNLLFFMYAPVEFLASRWSVITSDEHFRKSNYPEKVNILETYNHISKQMAFRVSCKENKGFLSFR